MFVFFFFLFFFFKQKTAYEMRISDWSSDVCSSDLIGPHIVKAEHLRIDQRPFEIIGGRRARIVDEVRDFLLKAGPGFHRDRIAPEGCVVGFPDDAALDEKVPSRSGARRGGKEGVRTGRSRGSPDH